MNKFSSLLDEPDPLLTPEEYEEMARSYRTAAARAHLAYSSAYWEYEEALVMEDACQTLAKALRVQQEA